MKQTALRGVTAMLNKERGWRFLYSRRWLGYYALLIIFAVACVLLSNWQFERKEQAAREIARIVNNYEKPAKPFEEVVKDYDTFNLDAQKWLPVTVTGKYLGKPVLVRGRPSAQGSGSHLLQGLLTANDTLVFVDRGWVDVTLSGYHDIDFRDLPVAVTGEEITVTGRLRVNEPVIAGRLPTENSVGTINTKELNEVAGTNTQAHLYSAGYLGLITESPEQPHGTLPDKPALDPGPHLSYALQWLVFIVIAVVGVTVAARKEFHNFNQERKNRNSKLLRVKTRRSLSDAEAEDIWLDSRI